MSDQDFFFDEDEATPAEPAAKVKSGSSSKPAPRATSAAPTGSFFDRETTMAVASLVGVIGLLVGVIVGWMLYGVVNRPAVVVPTPATGTSDGAPGALSNDQLQGGLPAGHPTIPGMSGASTATK